VVGIQEQGKGDCRVIITRTPYRVSFFGGGTDYRPWYEQHGGAVLTSTIDKYCYISARYMPPFLGAKYSVCWSKMERVNRLEEIEHPGVRACLQYLGVDQGFEVNHAGDLPARAGLGSSSAFTVGMLHALYALQGYDVIQSKSALAAAAVHIEQEVLKETVGIQDQIECAHGGLNVIEIAPSGDWTVTPLLLPPERLSALEARLMLFWTGLQRTASEIAKDQLDAMHKNTESLHGIRSLVGLAMHELLRGDLDAFGELLDYGWKLKRKLSGRISTDSIDSLYANARAAGAIGGKILGAGGGGFLLLYALPASQPSIRSALSGLLEIPFRFESEGSRLILR
jgi:D-glycero-alpha-D-manno-heptose-7-phosphate kinase